MQLLPKYDENIKRYYASMFICFIVVGVLRVVSAQTNVYKAQERGLCLQGFDVPGTSETSVAGITQCGSKCDRLERCVGFNWYRQSKICKFKHYLSKTSFDNAAQTLTGCSFFYRVSHFCYLKIQIRIEQLNIYIYFCELKNRKDSRLTAARNFINNNLAVSICKFCHFTSVLIKYISIEYIHIYFNK